MNEYELKQRFKNASAAFIRANLSVADALPDAEQRERTQALARSYEGKAQGPGLRHCRFTLRRKKLLDVDAKYSSIKDLLDCLTITGVIQGDKEGEITLEVNQIKCTKVQSEATMIEVFDCAPVKPSES